MEEHFFFKNRSEKKLFGVIHYPENKSTKGVLICHPLFEEKLHVHRALVDFSRLLSSFGFSVMRFDYYGEGDSEGEFEEATVETRLADMESALDTFKQKADVQKVVLLGVRFGATLSALFAEKDKRIDTLILWAPILRGSDYMQQLLRINLTHQVVVYKKVIHTREDLIRMLSEGKKVNVDGYEITRKLFEQISRVDLLSEDKNFFGKSLLIQFSQNLTEPNPDLERLRDLYSKKNLSELWISIDSPFWGDMKYYPPSAPYLFEKTLNWIKVNL